jgi:hypothetical protein
LDIDTVAETVIGAVVVPEIIKPVTRTASDLSPNPKATLLLTLHFAILEGAIVNTAGSVFVPDEVNAVEASVPGANVKVMEPL